MAAFSTYDTKMRQDPESAFKADAVYMFESSPVDMRKISANNKYLMEHVYYQRELN